MSDSHQAEQHRTGRIVDAPTFVHFLFHEIARYERYGHSFAVLLFEAPGEEDSPDRLTALCRASGEARDLLRACDLLAPFEDIGVLAVLLPETTLTGARAVLQRFILEAKELDADWTMKIAAYPDNAEVVNQLLAITEHLVEEERAISESTQAPAPEPEFLVPPFRPPSRPRLRNRPEEPSTSEHRLAG
jgi:hypothetical protein